MIFEWDAQKSLKNSQERGLPFEAVRQMDFQTAHVEEDTRYDYGERRFVAIGQLNGRLHVLCFTPIPHGIRVISLRRANLREVKYYEQETKTIDN
jgi:uncharacterized DUF497 family protein